MKWYLLKDKSKPKYEQYSFIKAQEAEVLNSNVIKDFYQQQGKEFIAEADSLTAIILHMQALLEDEKEQ